MMTNVLAFQIIYRSLLFRNRIFSGKRFRENQTHFCVQYFFRKPCLLWHNVETFCRAEQAKEDNMVHVHYMLDS